MKKDEGQQMAVVYFEQESAAKTAILLSQGENRMNKRKAG